MYMCIYIYIVFVLSVSHVWLFCNLMDCSPLGFSVHGISQARILEWTAISFSREASWPRDPPWVTWQMGFPGGSHGLPWWLSGKEFTCNVGDLGSRPGSGRLPGEGNGYPFQYSCLENSRDRGAWQATVHGDIKSQTRLGTEQQQQIILIIGIGSHGYGGCSVSGSAVCREVTGGIQWVGGDENGRHGKIHPEIMFYQ